MNLGVVPMVHVVNWQPAGENTVAAVSWNAGGKPVSLNEHNAHSIAHRINEKAGKTIAAVSDGDSGMEIKVSDAVALQTQIAESATRGRRPGQ